MMNFLVSAKFATDSLKLSVFPIVFFVAMIVPVYVEVGLQTF